MKGALLLESHLTSMRNERTFNHFYDQTVEESRSLTEEPKLPRNRKLPHRIDPGSSAPHYHACPKDRYRQIYYKAIDIVAEEIKRWFDQSDIRMIRVHD